MRLNPFARSFELTIAMPSVFSASVRSELVRARSYDRSVSTIWEGSAELELYDAPHEELTALAPVRVGRGFRYSFAYTIDDLETVAQL